MEQPPILPESRNTRMRDKRRREGWKRVEVWLDANGAKDLALIQADGNGLSVWGAVSGAIKMAAQEIRGERVLSDKKRLTPAS